MENKNITDGLGAMKLESSEDLRFILLQLVEVNNGKTHTRVELKWRK